jgi:hypothetical protein
MVWPPLYEFGDLSTLLKKTKQDKQFFFASVQFGFSLAMTLEHLMTN